MTFDSRANDPDAPEALTFVQTDIEASAVVAALKGCGIHASTTACNAAAKTEVPDSRNRSSTTATSREAIVTASGR